jgi:hypothetical protein
VPHTAVLCITVHSCTQLYFALLHTVALHTAHSCTAHYCTQLYCIVLCSSRKALMDRRLRMRLLVDSGSPIPSQMSLLRSSTQRRIDDTIASAGCINTIHGATSVCNAVQRHVAPCRTSSMMGCTRGMHDNKRGKCGFWHGYHQDAIWRGLGAVLFTLHNGTRHCDEDAHSVKVVGWRCHQDKVVRGSCALSICGG